VSKEELIYLSELLEKLRRAMESLHYSYKICSGIGIKPVYSEDEKDRFESLTAKFARLSDLIIKQSIKLIDILDLDEVPETVRDAINRAEKKGLISSAMKFIEIRKLRNRIAHEYAESDNDINDICASVLNNTLELCDSVDRIVAYTKKYVPEQ
jgi:uncharacterized protein YutE (UPF0331/DUF86 family)